MIYNFNLGIGWASSGVEYAQMYRARMFRNIGAKAKFVFTDMISSDNIQALTNNIGFLDDEIIWLYTYFTDCKIAPVSFTLKDFEQTLPNNDYSFERNGKISRYTYNSGDFYTVYMENEIGDTVHRVEIVSNGCLIRKDYYNYMKVFSEYYGPLDGRAHLYQRRFYNEDGTVVYDELVDGDNSMFVFKDKILYSKEEFVGYMVSCLELTEEDVVIIDRMTGIGQAILQNVGRARVGNVIHADHFSEGNTDDKYILWNNYYEYSFAQHKHLSFYICATDAQNELVRKQFAYYVGVEPNIVTIPVGSLPELKYPEGARKKHALITASRLASEKHVDWLVEATAKVHETVPDVSLDIYGKGGDEAMLKELIDKLDCGDYVHLCGQQNLTEVYKNYDAYFAASTSEGFGLSLMEAIGSGLPIVGFDVRYGNQTFIDDGENGYKIPVSDKMEKLDRVDKLAFYMTKMLVEDDIQAFQRHSYEKAEKYLTSEVEKRWKTLLG